MVCELFAIIKNITKRKRRKLLFTFCRPEIWNSFCYLQKISPFLSSNDRIIFAILFFTRCGVTQIHIYRFRLSIWRTKKLNTIEYCYWVKSWREAHVSKKGPRAMPETVNWNLKGSEQFWTAISEVTEIFHYNCLWKRDRKPKRS